jgi:hypothetical protein
MTIIVSQSGATVTATALSIIEDAYEWLNRLSPGETLGPDEAAKGLRRLNLLVDKLSAKQQFLFHDLLTSAAQTGNITLGVTPWNDIAPGAKIISATADNQAMAPISMQQYNQLWAPTSTGIPNVWAQDGLSTVFLYPAPTGQTIKLQTRIGVSAFADQTTEYTMPPGYKSALGIALAVKLAPIVLGRLPPELLREETSAMDGIKNYNPAILNVYSFSNPYAPRESILNGG